MTNDAPKNNLINFKTLQNCKLINPKMNPLLKDLQEFVKDSLYVIGHLPKISEILYQEAEERFNVEFDFCSGKCRESFHTILLAETIKFYIRLHCKRLNDLLRREWHKNGKWKSAYKLWVFIIGGCVAESCRSSFDGSTCTFLCFYLPSHPFWIFVLLSLSSLKLRKSSFCILIVSVACGTSFLKFEGGDFCLRVA